MRVYQLWQQNKDGHMYKRHKALKANTKRVVRVAMIEADERWGWGLCEQFTENKLMVWKDEKEMRKDDSVKQVNVNDEDWRVLSWRNKVCGRWKRCFEDLVIVSEKRCWEYSQVSNDSERFWINWADHYKKWGRESSWEAES